jgi:RNA polymerase sigma factor (sigma-70 family)
MKAAAGLAPVHQDRWLADVIEREQSRLRNFIRRRVPDRLDAEDILQDVFAKLVEANRLLMPIDHVTGWLFRIARNRITSAMSSSMNLRLRSRSSRKSSATCSSATSWRDGPSKKWQTRLLSNVRGR